MAFIPDNISAHVHLLEDNDPIKRQRWLLSAGVFHLANFPQNDKSVSAKIMTGLSLSILSAEKSQSIQLPTFSSCGANIRSGDNIFYVQVATTTVCMQWPTRVFVNHLKYVLKRVSFGSKDCTKELRLECADFLGQTS